MSDPVDPSTLVALMYRLILRREVDPATLAARVDALNAGVPFADMFVEIANSDEAFSRVQVRDSKRHAVWSTIVVSAYQSLLHRTPGAHEIQEWVNGLKDGLSVERFFEAVTDSEEAKTAPSARALGSKLSDGEFVLRSCDTLFGRGLNPQEIVFCQNIIDESPAKRVEFAINVINDQLKRKLAIDAQDEAPHDPTTTQIMGTDRTFSLKAWQERRKLLAMTRLEDGETRATESAVERPFAHTGAYNVSMIASLYRGGRYIGRFLDNVTSQTIFNSAELIIIDANSPDNEYEIIRQYQEQFPNIVYRRINYRIGIYEAWNVAIEIARGRYLTNTNLDDLRRKDSIALQAAVLDKNDDVDIVYQDFFYSFDPSLSFDEVAAYGFKSNVPIVTPHNLLLFNSPHNAPMWRARLHEEVGTFNPRYRSAGDHEFWARCLSQQKVFRKINTPHVVYYQNPKGVSTGPNTPGIEEGRDVIRRYCQRLIAPALLQSRRDFRVSLGAELTDDTMPINTPYYDVAQAALCRLGATRLATGAPPVTVPCGY